MINILKLEPTTISKDLRGKYIMLYGLPKVGKTSFAVQCPKNLLLAFEKGYNALGGIMAVDIEKWSDFKMALNQLKKPEAKEMYHTITIDTVGIAWDLCEKYICAQNNVTSIGDIPWGAGYELCKKEFENALRSITLMGYGLIIISHSAVRNEKIDDEHTIQIIEPNIKKRPYEIVNAIVDIIGYIHVEFDEDGNSNRTLYTRRTPTLVAGSRFKYLEPVIPFGYDNLAEAIVKAVEKEAEEKGVEVNNDANIVKPVIENRPFAEVVEEGKELWIKLLEKDENNDTVILDKLEEIFGNRKRLSEIMEGEKELFELLIIYMREML